MIGSEKLLVALISVVVGGMLGFMSKIFAPTMIERLTERREQEKAFRIHAAPICYAAYQAYRRVRNILDDGNHIALNDEWKGEPNWPMSHEYFIESTQYLFGIFFCSIELYAREIRNFIHAPKNKQKELNKYIRDAQRTLYDVSLNDRNSRDYQVYLLEQQAMSEALLSKGDQHTPIGFYEFRKCLHDDENFRLAFKPIEQLIINLLIDGDDFRADRLNIFSQRVRNIYDYIAKTFNNDIYPIEEKTR